MYAASVEDPDAFWSEQATTFLDWTEPFKTVRENDMAQGLIKWFSGGRLNVSVNCIDRHLPERADQVAIIWEGDEPGTDRKITYQELHDHVCQIANVLRDRGVEKGDRVCIYMPMIPEAAFAMLACARIGAIHSVVFGGFSPDSLKDRILDSNCQAVITSDESVRGGRVFPLKANTDTALSNAPMYIRCWSFSVPAVISTGLKAAISGTTRPSKNVPSECEPEQMEAEDPLFILYTSGSTGKPKGAPHNRRLPADCRHDSTSMYLITTMGTSTGVLLTLAG